MAVVAVPSTINPSSPAFKQAGSDADSTEAEAQASAAKTTSGDATPLSPEPASPFARVFDAVALNARNARNAGSSQMPIANCNDAMRPEARRVVPLSVSPRVSCETAREPMDERQHWDREARPKVAVVSAEQAASFAILLRPQVESDRLPESRSEIFDGDLIGRLGLNPALARRATTQVGDVWVVPGSGYIGLYVGGVGCARTEVAARRGMVTWTSVRSGLQDLVHGLVPDGVEEVTLLAANNASTMVFVNENLYGAVLDGHFTSGRFSGPTGTVEFGPAVS